MNNEILVSARRLEELIANGRCIVVDCRFDLAQSEQGRADWLEGHIPGAVYAHLDHDLAAPVGVGTGRHPLPDPDRFAAFLAASGWSAEKLLVAYDVGPNAFSARLWWLMRYFGHSSALLNGGLQAWLDAGLPLEAGEPDVTPTPVPRLVPDDSMVVSTQWVEQHLGNAEKLVVDARAPERYTGEVEPLDGRAGHIPGAINRAFSRNLEPSGQFRNRDELRAELETLLGGRQTTDVAHSCGSGVTACHNHFAMELAGLGPSLLYSGSWSAWISDPDRPVTAGPKP